MFSLFLSSVRHNILTCFVNLCLMLKVLFTNHDVLANKLYSVIANVLHSAAAIYGYSA